MIPSQVQWENHWINPNYQSMVNISVHECGSDRLCENFLGVVSVSMNPTLKKHLVHCNMRCDKIAFCTAIAALI